MENRLGEIRKNTFGTEMQIVRYGTYTDIDVKFLDKDGYVYQHTNYTNFKTGQIKNPYDRCIFGIGYLGEGDAQQKTQVGYCWRGMLERCYCDRMKKIHPAYYGISTVCDEWLNFQTFAKWYNENIYQVGTERMHLDKDILHKGNKVYSPKTCVFVPQSINKLFIKRDKLRGELPIGVYKDRNKFGAGLRKGNRRIHLGYFTSPNEAFQAYKRAKEEYIKEVAEKYKSQIPHELYEAMINYKVEIDD